MTSYGVTRIKDPADSTWKTLKGVWQKTPSGWTTVKAIWTKIDSSTWEIVYPTKKGNLIAIPSTISPVLYQGYNTNSIITLQNVGDDTLLINNPPVLNSGANFTITSASPTTTGWPVSLNPGQSIDANVNLFGGVPGTSPGNIIFNTYLGIMGNSSTTVWVNANTQPAYSLISVTPSGVTTSIYLGDTPTTPVPITISNPGTGAALGISSITSSQSKVTLASIPIIIAAGASATFTITPIAGLTGTRVTDQITIASNAKNITSFRIPVNIIINAVHGSADFTPGSVAWTVPDHVHSITVTGAAGGGGGGNGVGDVSGIGGVNNSTGGGGSAGVVITPTTIAVTPGETLVVTVGSGGIGGSEYRAVGGSGGITQILRGATILVSAAGGVGGPYGFVSSASGACGQNGCSNSLAAGGLGGSVTSYNYSVFGGGELGNDQSNWYWGSYSLGNGQGGGGGAGFYPGQNGITGQFVGNGGNGGNGHITITW